jgi:hypothetical protein
MDSIAAKAVSALRGIRGLFGKSGDDPGSAVPPPQLPSPPRDISPSDPQMASLRTTRDELAATLECLRQMTESPHPRPPEATGEGADPYPVICANLRAALAHLRRAEQAGPEPRVSRPA